MAGIRLAVGGREDRLSEIDTPLPLDRLVPGDGPWEVEIGFGKGRYLLRRAAAEPQVRFLGIEVAARYYRRVRDRSRRRALSNIVLLRGEALYMLSTILPTSFAAAVHVYFPDPWPKARHEDRRLFDVATVDLVIGLLEPGGVLYFATDFIDYAERVAEIIDSHPGVIRSSVPAPWHGEARTNYEAKYMADGRAIARFEVIRDRNATEALVHPAAHEELEAAVGGDEDRREETE